MNPLAGLGGPEIAALAAALETGRLRLPSTVAQVGIVVSKKKAAAVTAELNRLAQLGVDVRHVAWTLRLLADEKAVTQQVHDRVDLVWSGPELPGAVTRETGSVVRELFAMAKKRVLVSSYALDKGEKARDLFGELAARMDAEPDLQVRLFVNIRREHGSSAAESVIVREFRETFRKEIWPGSRLPEVFYDPRSLEPGAGPKSCLHAKCVIIDDERAFVTSANFTEAAQERNIEAGVLVSDPTVAKALGWQFEGLVEAGTLRRVGLP